MYEVRNNAETTLKQSLLFNGKLIIVEDTTKFPPTGLIRIGPPAGDPSVAEIIYYGSKTTTTFTAGASLWLGHKTPSSTYDKAENLAQNCARFGCIGVTTGVAMNALTKSSVLGTVAATAIPVAFFYNYYN